MQAGASVGGGVKLRQGAVTPEEGAVRRVSAKETRRVMDDALTERAALKLRFGLDGSSPGSLDVLGRQLGVTRVRGRSEHLPRLAVSPNSGLVTGERQVVISGTDLQGTGAPSVAIGGITGTNVLAVAGDAGRPTHLRYDHHAHQHARKHGGAHGTYASYLVHRYREIALRRCASRA